MFGTVYHWVTRVCLYSYVQCNLVSNLGGFPAQLVHIFENLSQEFLPLHCTDRALVRSKFSPTWNQSLVLVCGK